jgi:hypothetical protein
VRALFVLMIIIFSQPMYSQVLVKGMVVDSIAQMAMSPVRIHNIRNNANIYTLADGSFSIDCKEKDILLFSYIGYKNVVLHVQENMHEDEQRIRMNLKPLNLKEVVIRQEQSDYQKDSARVASLYKDVIGRRHESEADGDLRIMMLPEVGGKQGHQRDAKQQESKRRNHSHGRKRCLRRCGGEQNHESDTRRIP